MALEDMLPGMSGEFAAKSTISSLSPESSPSPSPVPKTPVSRKVYESAMKLPPGLAHVHKLPLREFQESDPVSQHSNSTTPMPSFRRRSNSLCSLASSGDMTRPNSVEAKRALSRHEVDERNQSA